MSQTNNSYKDDILEMFNFVKDIINNKSKASDKTKEPNLVTNVPKANVTNKEVICLFLTFQNTIHAANPMKVRLRRN